jgi:hypothetical protein
MRDKNNEYIREISAAHGKVSMSATLGPKKKEPSPTHLTLLAECIAQTLTPSK